MIAVHVRPSALLPAALAMIVAVGCASIGRSAGLGQAVTLQPGERVTLPDSASLRYLRVTADSRCPPDVQCIRAGDADVAFEFRSGAGSGHSITLNTANAPAAPIGRWRLRLLSLGSGPAPPVTFQVD
ncbi:MAG TPA: hypothetical protein VIK70_11980 [Lysobacter sp.]